MEPTYLNAEVTTVNVVTEEEVACLSRVTANFEQLHEVIVLSVDVSADGDGCVHLQQVWLLAENLRTFLDDP
jgi:hypothetical protein